MGCYFLPSQVFGSRPRFDARRSASHHLAGSNFLPPLRPPGSLSKLFAQSDYCRLASPVSCTGFSPLRQRCTFSLPVNLRKSQDPNCLDCIYSWLLESAEDTDRMSLHTPLELPHPSVQEDQLG